MLLFFAYRETGGATVACLALTAIAIELNDAVTKWNNKVEDLKYQELQIRIMGMTEIIENTVVRITGRKAADNGDNETGTERH